VQEQFKIEMQVNYPICGVDSARGAAVQEELYSLHAHTIFRGNHHHSLSILYDKNVKTRYPRIKQADTEVAQQSKGSYQH
jgi:hypothetical protein